MARIRKLEIHNFRSIKSLTWLPRPGFNCLIGPGDSGKSTILDAIDYCIGARRTLPLSDADFHRLNVDEPVTIEVTVGDLENSFKKIDTYGLYVRGFDLTTGQIEDEPEADLETVLTVLLTIPNDLEPVWTLVSERAVAQNQSRNLTWADRARLAPTRLGAMAGYNLSWRRGSVLNRVSEEQADASAALAKAAREARGAFGDEAQDQLKETLEIVSRTATELGIPVGDSIRAMLDAHTVTFGGGTISLHDQDGVPLKSLGTGSTRLLIAGLQRKAAEQSPVILIDELEYGLEPHRIIRLLGSLGAKDDDVPVQAFVTTHSPVALRELSGDQLFIVQMLGDEHEVRAVGSDNTVQGTIRSFPDAFLAPSVLVCEGATEVGLIRGLDQYWAERGEASISALGVALVDGGGSQMFKRAVQFQHMGYRTAVIRDDDKQQTPELEEQFKKDGGKVFIWRDERALEEELFMSLTDAGVIRLLDDAIERLGDSMVDDHLKSASDGKVTSKSVRDNLDKNMRKVLGKAATNKSNSWFKTVSIMERAARTIVAEDFKKADEKFKKLIKRVFSWCAESGLKIPTEGKPKVKIERTRFSDS